MKFFLKCSILILILLVSQMNADEFLHPFTDASTINEDVNSAKIILEKYRKHSKFASFDELLQNNIFLRKALPDLDSITITPQNDTKTFQSAPGERFNLASPTIAVDALGTFIVRRFKEELNIAYLDKFKSMLQNEKDLNELLPTTTKFLIQSDPYNYSTFLEVLKASFEEDLQNLLKNIPELLKLKEQEIIDKLGGDGYHLLLLIITAINNIADNKPAAEIIITFTSNKEVALIENSNVRNSIELLGYVIEELTVINGYDFIKKTKLEKLLKMENQKQIDLFIGLIYEKYRIEIGEIQFIKKSTEVIKLSNNLDILSTFIQYVTNKVNDVLGQLNVIKREWQFHGKQSVATYGRYAESLIDLIVMSFSIQKASTGLNSDDFLNNKIPLYSRELLAISRNISEEDYGSMLVHLLAFFDDVLKDSKFKTRFMKYGTFIVNVSVAKNSEEMTAALESAALPVGSYRIKRNTTFNIALNSYFGFFWRCGIFVTNTIQR